MQNSKVMIMIPTASLKEGWEAGNIDLCIICIKVERETKTLNQEAGDK